MSRLRRPPPVRLERPEAGGLGLNSGVIGGGRAGGGTGRARRARQGTYSLVHHIIIKEKIPRQTSQPQRERPDLFFPSIVVFLVVVQGQFE